MGDTDIRRWFLKQPHKKESNDASPKEKKAAEQQSPAIPDSRADLKKTSKYFPGSKAKPGSDDDGHQLSSAGKRKQENPTSEPKQPSFPSPKKTRIEQAPLHVDQKPKTSSARASTPDEDDFEDVAQTPSSASPASSRGRGRGRGRGRSGVPSTSPEQSKPASSGRGRGGGGRAGAPFYQPRQPPPHKGEKDVPEGAENCLAGSTFVISGTLDSLEREEAEDLIKRHGGRVTTSISKKTSYLLADEDVGGRKSQKAKELGVPFLTEDGLFDLIRSSKPSKPPPKQQEKKSNLQDAESPRQQPARASPAQPASTSSTGAPRDKQTFSSAIGEKSRTGVETEAWPQKYSPKNIGEIIGNQSVPHKKESNDASPKEKKAAEQQSPAIPDSRADLKKTSKYFPGSKAKPGSDDDGHQLSSAGKRKQENPTSEPKQPSFPSPKKTRIEQAPLHVDQKPKTSSARASTPDEDDFEDVAQTPSSASPASSRGRGRGRGRGRSGVPSTSPEQSKPASSGRGQGGGGRAGAPFYQPRQPPPHKGEKDVPEGAENCLAGSTFVISGTLDSLEREEAEDLIKRHGGRVTTSISKKTSYLLADEDVGGRKSQKAKELGVPFLTEDGLFDLIRSSKPSKPPPKQQEKKSNLQDAESPRQQPARASPAQPASTSSTGAPRDKQTFSSAIGEKSRTGVETEAWPQKYSPKNIGEIIGNQSVVKQLQDWLQQWFEQNSPNKQQKGKKRGGDSSNVKKAVLLSGPPGIGKTTSARVISNLLGFEAFEVNASDNRGKADAKVGKGISGSTANAIKEMVSNEAIAFGVDRDKHRKSVLIMDEVDGMSGGDRGGVADLIASIKISKIPVICICNDRYSQKLKSLINYCLPLNYRKPTKQQMAKRLQQIARAEGMQVDEIALEELAERVNGDMRMALNQLQYMSLRMRSIKFDDVKARLSSSAKDEDISPFNAVDKLMSYDGGRLRMDARLDASMSDLDLVPLLIQENYLNYCPALAGRDENGTARMDLIARSAACIADGDIVNVQIRQYRQWQHAQMAAFMSSIIPAALMHGRRETLTQGERNFNRFGSWLGKNSSYGKKLRLLDDIHVHMLASRTCEPTRQAVRRDYLHVLALKLTTPLKEMPKEAAVKTVVDVMEDYSFTQEDLDSVFDLIKFQGQPDPMAGVQPAVKAALTKAYKQRESDRRVRSSDLLPVFTVAGQKKLPKKRTRLQISPAPLEDNELGEDDEELDADVDEDDSNGDELAALEANEKLELNLEESNGKAGKQRKGSTAPRKTASKEAISKPPAKRRKG
ncbi:hypothetical protein GOP47_0026652 [Adiantum capillus-veneris]|nr:hypothetical protein GOP47_0026652 [Adiantum capillus-veneris]